MSYGVMVTKGLRIIISHLKLFQGVMVIKGLRVNLLTNWVIIRSYGEYSFKS